MSFCSRGKGVSVKGVSVGETPLVAYFHCRIQIQIGTQIRIPNPIATFSEVKIQAKKNFQ